MPPKKPKKRDGSDLETQTKLPKKPTARVPSRNPVNDQLFNLSVDETAQRFAHFIDFKLFSPSPQGFVQTLEKSCLGYTESLTLEIIGYICSQLAQKTQPADDHQACVSFFQVVRRPDQHIIGLVWHVFYQFTDLNPGEIIKKLIQDNTESYNEAIQQSKVPKRNAYQYNSFSIEKYKALVSFYKALDTATISLDNIIQDDHDFSFNNAFSLDTCLIRMKDAGCDEQLLSCDYGTGFPNPVDVFFVQSALLVPQKLFTYLFPHLPPATYTSGKDRAKFKELHPRINEELLNKIFDQELATNATTAGERTFEDLGVLVNEKKQRFIEIHNDTNLTKEQKQLKCEQLQNEIDTWALKEYEILLTPMGKKGLAEAAIENWFHEDFLKTHKNACMPRKKLFNNMSRLAQYINELLASCEALHEINVTHQQIILYYLSCFTAHRGRGLRLHHLGLGTAATGKSFSLMSFIKWLIEGSYIELSTVSTKAFNVAGDPYNGAIIIFEEVPRSLICKNTTDETSADGSGDNNGLNIFKTILSEGTGNFASNNGTVDGVAGTGSRTTCKVEACFFMATNENGKDISDPIISRCHLSRFTNIHRSGSGSRSCKKNETPDRIAANEAFVTRARRTQALMKKIYNLQTCNILPRVEIKIGDIIINDIENEAKKMGCTEIGSDQRQKARLFYLIEVLVMIDAIDCVFDTEYSEIQNECFSHKQMLRLRKYLVATQEHISIALGLLSSAYEDPILHGVIETCKKTIFNQSIQVRHQELNDLGYHIDTYGNVILKQQQFNDEMKEEEKKDDDTQYPNTDPRSKNYQSNTPPSVENPLYNRYHYKYTFPIRKGGSNDFREKFEAFIDLIYDSMGKSIVNRPSRYLVGSCLRNLAKQQMNVYDPIDKEWSKVSKLYVDDKTFYLAIPLIDMFKNDPIREALIKTLSHQYTLDTSILYGKTEFESNKPYEMPFLHIKRDPSRLLRRRDGDYYKPQTIKLLSNLIEGVHTYSIADEVFKPSTERIYSDKPLHIVDADTDQLAVSYHISQQNISQTVSTKYPAAYVRLRQKQEECLIKMHRKEPLTKFLPTKLEKYDTDEWMDDKTLLDSDFTRITSQIRIDADLNDEDFDKSIEDTSKIITLRSMIQDDENHELEIEQESSNKRQRQDDEEEKEEDIRPKKKQRARIIDDDDDLPSYQEEPNFDDE